MGRHSKAVKLVGGVRDGFALLDDDECRWAIEAGERYIDDGIGFFRGTARPGTALMVAYVDEFRDRFRAGIGRGRVTSVMWEPGIRGVRRGGTPVTARPAKGRGRRARPRGTRVRGGAPGPAARGRHRLRAHGQRTLRLHGARPPTCSPAGVCDQIKVFGVRW